MGHRTRERSSDGLPRLASLEVRDLRFSKPSVGRIHLHGIGVHGRLVMTWRYDSESFARLKVKKMPDFIEDGAR